MRRRVLAGAFVGAFDVGRAASGQVVMGRVVDSASRRPLPRISVQLLRAGGDSAAAAPVRTSTAPDGTFSFTTPGVGAYYVQFADGFRGPVLTLASVDSVDQHEYVVPLALDRIFLKFQVEKQAALRGGLRPTYPSELQRRGIQGRVVAQFVVSAAGRAEPGTFKVLQSTDPLFVGSVRAAVLAASFYPAEVAGRPVRELMQQTVGFTINQTISGTPPEVERTLGRVRGMSSAGPPR